MSEITIIDTNEKNITNYGFCGAKSLKHEGYCRKVDWIKQRYKEGMKMKILINEDGKSSGMIEYVPGKYAWRAVNAEPYMFIHCILLLSKKDREKGNGSLLIKECEKDAKNLGLSGVAVLASSGTWMASGDIFLKNGFEVASEYPPVYALMAKKFRKTKDPEFKSDYNEKLKKYGSGITIIYSDQCPNTAKGHNDIKSFCESSNISLNLIKCETSSQAQDTPTPYGTYCIIYNGKLLTEHPISKTRFVNIIKKQGLLK